MAHSAPEHSPSERSALLPDKSSMLPWLAGDELEDDDAEVKGRCELALTKSKYWAKRFQRFLTWLFDGTPPELAGPQKQRLWGLFKMCVNAGSSWYIVKKSTVLFFWLEQDKGKLQESYVPQLEDMPPSNPPYLNLGNGSYVVCAHEPEGNIPVGTLSMVDALVGGAGVSLRLGVDIWHIAYWQPCLVALRQVTHIFGDFAERYNPEIFNAKLLQLEGLLNASDGSTDSEDIMRALGWDSPEAKLWLADVKMMCDFHRSVAAGSAPDEMPISSRLYSFFEEKSAHGWKAAVAEFADKITRFLLSGFSVLRGILLVCISKFFYSLVSNDASVFHGFEDLTDLDRAFMVGGLGLLLAKSMLQETYASSLSRQQAALRTELKGFLEVLKEAHVDFPFELLMSAGVDVEKGMKSDDITAGGADSDVSVGAAAGGDDVSVNAGVGAGVGAGAAIASAPARTALGRSRAMTLVRESSHFAIKVSPEALTFFTAECTKVRDGLAPKSVEELLTRFPSAPGTA